MNVAYFCSLSNNNGEAAQRDALMASAFMGTEGLIYLNVSRALVTKSLAFPVAASALISSYSASFLITKLICD